MNGEKPVSDFQRQRQASTRAGIRGAAALYILYLGWSILRDTVKGASTLPVWLGWLAGLGFMAAALAFGVYTYRRYLVDRAPVEPEAEQTGDKAGDTGDAP